MSQSPIVHRYRFSDWIPSPIRSIATDLNSEFIAVGRENGDIEFKFFTQAKICGETNFQLRYLVFSPLQVESGRLFGISLRGFIFEVSFKNLSIFNIRDSFGGSAWALAASPREAKLALSCEDGSLKIFSYADNSLEYLKTLTNVGTRILAIAYHSALPVVACGCSDGTIRILDEKTGVTNLRLSGDIFKGTPVHIWSVLVLDDFTIVSGDNSGRLQFWDGTNGSLVKTILQHASAIYCICASPDQSQVFASGVDSKVVCVGSLPASNSSISPADREWVYSSALRSHSHDVTTLSIVSSKESPVLLSGGLDCKMCVYSITNFSTSRPTWIMPVSPTQTAKASSSCSLVAIRHFDSVAIWKLTPRTLDERNQRVSESSTALTESSPRDANGSCLTVCSIKAKGDQGISCISLSSRGNMIAMASGSRISIWKLKTNELGKILLVKIPVENIFPSLQSIHAMCFNHDNSTLAIAVLSANASTSTFTFTQNYSRSILLVDISDYAFEDTEIESNALLSKASSTPIVKLRHAVRLNDNELNFHGFYKNLQSVVAQIEFSRDNKWMGVRTCGCGVKIYDLDRLNLHWELPISTVPCTCIGFHPTSHNSIVVIYADNSFLLYDIAERDLCPWSKENNFGVSKSLAPHKSSLVSCKMYSLLNSISSVLQGISFDPTVRSGFVLYGQGALVYIDIEQQFNSTIFSDLSLIESSDAEPKINQKRRRKQDAKSSSLPVLPWKQRRNFTILNTYRSLVHVGLQCDSEMVVIENPWVKILQNLPATLQRKRYGT